MNFDEIASPSSSSNEGAEARLSDARKYRERLGIDEKSGGAFVNGKHLTLDEVSWIFFECKRTVLYTYGNDEGILPSYAGFNCCEHAIPPRTGTSFHPDNARGATYSHIMDQLARG